MAQQELKIEELNYSHNVYDFMQWNYLVFSISIILLIASIAIIAVHGFNLGLDFTGGMIIELKLEKTENLEQIRSKLEQAGFKDLIVQYFDSNRDIIVRILPMQENFCHELENKIICLIHKTLKQKAFVKSIEFIGPSIGNDLMQDGIIALLISLICILIYISYRFEWRLAAGSVLALIHDIIITLGILSLFSIEIDMTIIASLMSVIGYSLNDSVVISDRIRENFRKLCCYTAYDIFNISLTQTLNRTIITSATTMIVVIILLIFGGTMLRGFSITLCIGIFIGTISSIYVASSLALKLGMKHNLLL